MSELEHEGHERARAPKLPRPSSHVTQDKDAAANTAPIASRNHSRNGTDRLEAVCTRLALTFAQELMGEQTA